VAIKTDGPGRGTIFQGLDFENYSDLRRSNLNSAVSRISTHSCGHHRATVRNVVELGGAAVYLCNRCFGQIRAVETCLVRVNRVRHELAALFRNLWPPGSNPGASPAAWIGAERRAAR